MGNGGCLYNNHLLFCDQGTMDSPSQLVLVDPVDSSKSHPILDSFHGRPFNSLNDVITLQHPHDPSRTLIFFTDPTYGYEQSYRPRPQLPPQVYCFDPSSGDLRAIADGFDHPNGICFSPRGDVCYITDTGHIHGSGVIDPSKTSTM
jgi:gluconolactonase